MDNRKQYLTNRVVRLGLILSLALLVSYIESLVPVSLGIPGIKLGLANSVLLCMLYKEDIKGAGCIMVLRVILIGFMFGNLISIVYSLSGAMLSFLAMIVLKKIGGFSVLGVSMAGGVSHNVGQLLMAGILLQTKALLYYCPVLFVSGLIMGFLVGLISKEIQKRLPKNMT